MEQATKTPQQLTAQFQTNVKLLDDILGVSRNYDISGRELRIGGRQAHLYFLDGYGKDDVIERILAFLLSLTEQQLGSVKDMDDFASRFGTYGETGTETGSGYDRHIDPAGQMRPAAGRHGTGNAVRCEGLPHPRRRGTVRRQGAARLP